MDVVVVNQQLSSTETEDCDLVIGAKCELGFDPNHDFAAFYDNFDSLSPCSGESMDSDIVYLATSMVQHNTNVDEDENNSNDSNSHKPAWPCCAEDNLHLTAGAVNNSCSQHPQESKWQNHYEDVCDSQSNSNYTRPEHQKTASVSAGNVGYLVNSQTQTASCNNAILHVNASQGMVPSQEMKPEEHLPMVTEIKEENKGDLSSTLGPSNRASNNLVIANVWSEAVPIPVPVTSITNTDPEQSSPVYSKLCDLKNSVLDNTSKEHTSKRQTRRKKKKEHFVPQRDVSTSSENVPLKPKSQMSKTIKSVRSALQNRSKLQAQNTMKSGPSGDRFRSTELYLPQQQPAMDGSCFRNASGSISQGTPMIYQTNIHSTSAYQNFHGNLLGHSSHKSVSNQSAIPSSHSVSSNIPYIRETPFLFRSFDKTLKCPEPAPPLIPLESIISPNMLATQTSSHVIQKNTYPLSKCAQVPSSVMPQQAIYPNTIQNTNKHPGAVETQVLLGPQSSNVHHPAMNVTSEQGNYQSNSNLTGRQKDKHHPISTKPGDLRLAEEVHLQNAHGQDPDMRRKHVGMIEGLKDIAEVKLPTLRTQNVLPGGSQTENPTIPRADRGDTSKIPPPENRSNTIQANSKQKTKSGMKLKSYWKHLHESNDSTNISRKRTIPHLAENVDINSEHKRLKADLQNVVTASVTEQSRVMQNRTENANAGRSVCHNDTNSGNNTKNFPNIVPLARLSQVWHNNTENADTRTLAYHSDTNIPGDDSPSIFCHGHASTSNSVRSETVLPKMPPLIPISSLFSRNESGNHSDDPESPLAYSDSSYVMNKENEAAPCQSSDIPKADDLLNETKQKYSRQTSESLISDTTTTSMDQFSNDELTNGSTSSSLPDQIIPPNFINIAVNSVARFGEGTNVSKCGSANKTTLDVHLALQYRLWKNLMDFEIEQNFDAVEDLLVSKESQSAAFLIKGETGIGKHGKVALSKTCAELLSKQTVPVIKKMESTEAQETLKCDSHSVTSENADCNQSNNNHNTSTKEQDGKHKHDCSTKTDANKIWSNKAKSSVIFGKELHDDNLKDDEMAMGKIDAVLIDIITTVKPNVQELITKPYALYLIPENNGNVSEVSKTTYDGVNEISEERGLVQAFERSESKLSQMEISSAHCHHKLNQGMVAVNENSELNLSLFEENRKVKPVGDFIVQSYLADTSEVCHVTRNMKLNRAVLSSCGRSEQASEDLLDTKEAEDSCNYCISSSNKCSRHSGKLHQKLQSADELCTLSKEQTLMLDQLPVVVEEAVEKLRSDITQSRQDSQNMEQVSRNVSTMQCQLASKTRSLSSPLSRALPSTLENQSLLSVVHSRDVNGKTYSKEVDYKHEKTQFHLHSDQDDAYGYKDQTEDGKEVSGNAEKKHRKPWRKSLLNPKSRAKDLLRDFSLSSADLQIRTKKDDGGISFDKDIDFRLYDSVYSLLMKSFDTVSHSDQEEMSSESDKDLRRQESQDSKKKLAGEIELNDQHDQHAISDTRTLHKIDHMASNQMFDRQELVKPSNIGTNSVNTETKDDTKIVCFEHNLQNDDTSPMGIGNVTASGEEVEIKTGQKTTLSFPPSVKENVVLKPMPQSIYGHHSFRTSGRLESSQDNNGQAIRHFPTNLPLDMSVSEIQCSNNSTKNHKEDHAPQPNTHTKLEKSHSVIAASGTELSTGSVQTGSTNINPQVASKRKTSRTKTCRGYDNLDIMRKKDINDISTGDENKFSREIIRLLPQSDKDPACTPHRNARVNKGKLRLNKPMRQSNKSLLDFRFELKKSRKTATCSFDKSQISSRFKSPTKEDKIQPTIPFATRKSPGSSLELSKAAISQEQGISINSSMEKTEKSTPSNQYQLDNPAANETSSQKSPIQPLSSYEQVLDFLFKVSQDNELSKVETPNYKEEGLNQASFKSTPTYTADCTELDESLSAKIMPFIAMHHSLMAQKRPGLSLPNVVCQGSTTLLAEATTNSLNSTTTGDQRAEDMRTRADNQVYAPTQTNPHTPSCATETGLFHLC